MNGKSANPVELEFTLALTPALSPRRGRIVCSGFGEADTLNLCVDYCNNTESGTAKEIEQFSSNPRMLSLSPGERAGVRASVITVLPRPLTLESNY